MSLALELTTPKLTTTSPCYMALQLRDPSTCRFDLLSLGECMIRLAPPGHGRIEFAKVLEVDVGGGEFNVAYACARLGLRCGFIRKLPDNPVAPIIFNHPPAGRQGF